ncbi:hypothetical protein Tco_0572636 [Tanacetum coccineum]
MVNESLTSKLERYKERVTIFEQRLNVDLNKHEKLIDSQMNDLIRNRNAKLAAFQQEIDTLKETLYTYVKEKESLAKTLTVFKTESKEKESMHIDFLSKALPQRVWVLRVADSHIGNCLEDNFTPLETIRRFQNTIGRRSHSSSKGRPSSQRGGAKDSVTIQTYELSKEEFNDFLTLYPIPSEYHVILPKSNQTVFDASPGFIYRGSTLLVVPSSPLLLSCAKLIVVSPLSTSSEAFSICIELQRPAIMAGDKEMAFRNFIYTEDDKDLSFLPKEPSSGFGTGSSSVSINTEPLKANEEPVIQSVEVTKNYGESPQPELFVVHPRSVVTWIKDWKCKTRGGSSSPLVKRKLAHGSSTSRATHAKTSSSKDDAPFLTVSDDDEGLPNVLELKDATDCHLKIFAITPPAWKNHLDNHMDVELLDLHDRYYARQAVVDNAVNRRSHELLQVIEKLRGEFDVMRNKERAREEECEGLQVKCEAAMTEFKKNPVVVALREKISILSTEVKEHKLNLDRIMLESQKWAGYQQNLSTLESKVTFLKAEKARLEVVEVSLRKEVEDFKRDRREVVSKFVPYAAMELVYSDGMGSLVGRLVSSAILYGRCRAYEQVADMKEPFDLSKVKGYRSFYKKDHTQASNDFATDTFPWLDKFVADPSALIEVLLSKKPPSLQRPVPSRTQVPLPTSQRATPSSAPVSNPMSLLQMLSLRSPNHLHFNEGNLYFDNGLCRPLYEQGEHLMPTLKWSKALLLSIWWSVLWLPPRISILLGPLIGIALCISYNLELLLRRLCALTDNNILAL